MAATRENVLAAIVQYVENNKRRAPAKAIADVVGDTIPNVKAIVKALVEEGAVESSRGRNGGAKPLAAGDKATFDAVIAQVDKIEAVDPVIESADVAAQFAALIAQLEQDGADQQAAVG